VNLLLPTPLACAIEPLYMLRLADAAAALERYPYPAEVSGRLTLTVRDGWLLHNEDNYAIEVAGGKAQITRLAHDVPVQLACEVGTLAQLITRAIRPRVAATFGALDVRDRAGLRLAEQLFAGLPPFASDWF
jgi:predicted acetyltransferase